MVCFRDETIGGLSVVFWCLLVCFIFQHLHGIGQSCEILSSCRGSTVYLSMDVHGNDFFSFIDMYLLFIYLVELLNQFERKLFKKLPVSSQYHQGWNAYAYSTLPPIHAGMFCMAERDIVESKLY